MIPLVRVERGDPDDAELAALTIALLAVAQQQPPRGVPRAVHASVTYTSPASWTNVLGLPRGLPHAS